LNDIKNLDFLEDKIIKEEIGKQKHSTNRELISDANGYTSSNLNGYIRGSNCPSGVSNKPIQNNFHDSSSLNSGANIVVSSNLTTTPQFTNQINNTYSFLNDNNIQANQNNSYQAFNDHNSEYIMSKISSNNPDISQININKMMNPSRNENLNCQESDDSSRSLIEELKHCFFSAQYYTVIQKIYMSYLMKNVELILSYYNKIQNLENNVINKIIDSTKNNILNRKSIEDANFNCFFENLNKNLHLLKNVNSTSSNLANVFNLNYENLKDCGIKMFKASNIHHEENKLNSSNNKTGFNSNNNENHLNSRFSPYYNQSFKNQCNSYTTLLNFFNNILSNSNYDYSTQINNNSLFAFMKPNDHKNLIPNIGYNKNELGFNFRNNEMNKDLFKITPSINVNNNININFNNHFNNDKISNLNLLNYNNNNKHNSEISPEIPSISSTINPDMMHQNQYVPIPNSDHLHVMQQSYSDNYEMDCKELVESSSMFYLL